jgi:hypothetical protein
MQKHLLRVGLITVAVVLILPLLFGPINLNDYQLSVGIVALGVALLEILVGLLMVIDPKTRQLGQAVLLISALMLLASFTLCSTAKISFH